MSYVIFLPGLDEVVTSILISLNASDSKFLKNPGDPISSGETFYKIGIELKKGGIFGSRETSTFDIKSPISGQVHEKWRVLGFTSRHYGTGNRTLEVKSYSNALMWGHALAVNVNQPMSVNAGSLYSGLIGFLISNADVVEKRFASNEGYFPTWRSFLGDELNWLNNLTCPCIPSADL